MNTPSWQEDHVSQIPALQLLINMGYEYLTPSKALELRGNRTNHVLLDDVLRAQLKRINKIHRKGQEHEFSDSNINGAVVAIRDLPMPEGFLTANAAFYDLVTLGKSFEQSIDGDKKSYTIHYVDWEHPENNVFHVTEELSVLRTGRTEHYRPDIVLYINGIPTVIIECKSSALSGTKSPVDLAIEQHIRNFGKSGIRSLYVYSSLLLSIAVNDSSYATTGTSKEFWSKWKELFRSSAEKTAFDTTLSSIKNKPLSQEQKGQLFAERKFGFSYAKPYFDSLESHERKVTQQDEILFSLCEPKRLLDFIRNYTVYDDGIKKVARYQQHHAIKETLQRVVGFDDTGRRKGGVIWHTQGSGKSLTMVMLAQLLAVHPNITNPKILLVTDRIDLDDQISTTFKKCGKEVIQAKTGTHLAELIVDSGDAIITTIINKFQAAVKQVKKPFTSADIFVLIDEGHRTQYGTFSVQMQRVFPNACFLAFTGTPLMKRERSTAAKFGGYIGNPYTVNDAVADKAVVPLLYEGRHNLFTINEEPLNRYFDRVSEPLSDYGKVQLKKKFNTVNELNKAEQVVYARAWDISDHYTKFFQTEGAYKPKAQLVAPSIKTALLYKRYLDDVGLVSSEVVVTQTDQREGEEDGFEHRNEEKKREDEYFEAMIDKYGSIRQYEKSIINQFKKRDHPEILIVVAKLLTGFDAPCNTILYLCRSLKEHTLLQAIARVNRVHPGKDYGYIIDYYGNLEHLDSALTTYSGLSDFDEGELEGTLTHITKELERLPQAHSELWDIFKELKGRAAEVTDYEELLSPEDVRKKFYTKLSLFGRLLKLALSSVEFMDNTPEEKIDKYKKDAKFFLKLRVDVTRRYNDDISYKEFEPQIQKLINQHISTEGEIQKITELVNIFDKDEREAEVEKITGKAAKADHISSRTVKAINVKMQEDPVYYKKLAELIKETIAAYHQKRIDEAEFLKQAKAFEQEFLDGKRDNVPAELQDNPVAIAFYNQSRENYPDTELLKSSFHTEVGLAIDKTVKKHIHLNDNKIVDWHKSEDITGKITIAAGDAVYELLSQQGVEADWDKIDAMLEECLKIAKLKYQ